MRKVRLYHSRDTWDEFEFSECRHIAPGASIFKRPDGTVFATNLPRLVTYLNDDGPEDANPSFYECDPPTEADDGFLTLLVNGQIVFCKMVPCVPDTGVEGGLVVRFRDGGLVHEWSGPFQYMRHE